MHPWTLALAGFDTPGRKGRMLVCFSIGQHTKYFLCCGVHKVYVNTFFVRPISFIARTIFDLVRGRSLTTDGQQGMKPSPGASYISWRWCRESVEVPVSFLNACLPA